MGKNTDKLVDAVNVQLKAIERLEQQLEKAGKTVLDEINQHGGDAAMGAVVSRMGTASKQLDKAAKVANLFKPKLTAANNAALRELAKLEKHISEKEKSRKLPWKSESVKKAKSYIKSVKDYLGNTDQRLTDFQKDCKFRAEICRILTPKSTQVKRDLSNETD